MDTEKWLDNYTKWLRKQYSVSHLEDSDEINTPFLNNINDNIRFYVSQLSEKRIQLDDDGETLNNIYMMGIDINIPQRQLLLNSILKEFGIDKFDDVLSVSGKPTKFPEMKQNLISAILRIDDLNMFKKQDISRLFFEELYSYLDKNDFGGLPKYPIEGQSGNSYKIDYAIAPNHKENKLLRLLDFQNSINFNQVAIAAYKFNDISQISSNKIQPIIIYNDTEKKPPEKAINTAKDSGISLYAASDKSLLEEIK
ncbi:DUF1828 domain-containing protein [Pediococcus parvulus]